jgi:hypothetical protein
LISPAIIKPPLTDFFNKDVQREISAATPNFAPDFEASKALN